MSAPLTTLQRQLLRVVDDGRVTFKDPFPRLRERTGSEPRPRWHMSGLILAEGWLRAAVADLATTGHITEPTDGGTAVLTDQGRAALGQPVEAA